MPELGQFELDPDHFAGLPAELGLALTGVAPAPVGGLLDAVRAQRSAFARYATPERSDRLYPGDVAALLQPDGGTTFAHGAAGVIWTQRLLGLLRPCQKPTGGRLAPRATASRSQCTCAGSTADVGVNLQKARSPRRQPRVAA